MASLNQKILERTPLILPLLPEQRAIAAVLGSLDNKIELLREQNETLEALAQTLFKHWFIDFNFPCLFGYAKRTQAAYPELSTYGHKDFGGLPQPEENVCFVYVLRLENGNRYVGMTDFLLRCFHEHKTGKGAKATQASPPVAVIHYEAFDSREAVAEREQWLKTDGGRKWLDQEEEKGTVSAHVMQAPMSASELGEIPAGWRVGTLSETVKLNSQSWSAKRHPAKIEYVDLANTKNGVILKTETYDFKEAPSRARRILSQFDTIIGTVRPGNKSYALIGAENQLTGSTGFAVCSPKQPEQKEFNYLALTRNEAFNRLEFLADGSAYPAVNPEVIISEVRPIPNSEIFEQFSDLTNPFLSKTLDNQKKIQTLTQLRDTLLPKLMRGEIRVAVE